MSEIWRSLGKRRQAKLSRQYTKAKCHDIFCNPYGCPCCCRE